MTKESRLLARILLPIRSQKTMKTMSEKSRARQLFPADNQRREPIPVPDAYAEELSSFTEHAPLEQSRRRARRVLLSRRDERRDGWRGNSRPCQGLPFPAKVATLLELERAAIRDAAHRVEHPDFTAKHLGDE